MPGITGFLRIALDGIAECGQTFAQINDAHHGDAGVDDDQDGEYRA